MNDAIYCVVYRMGGTDNPTWHRTLAMTHREAITAAQSIQRGGRTAHIVNHKASMAIGLPEGLSA